MMFSLRPLPAAIVCMGLLAGSKAVGLVHHVGIGVPARADTAARGEKPAAAVEQAAPAAQKPGVQATKPASDPVKPAAAADCAEPPVSDTERGILQDLRERRRQLDARKAQLDERESLLAAADSQLSERIKQLTALQSKLEALDKERRDREEANWSGLVKTYEAMKPRDAATIFNDLDNSILVQVLDRMKERSAAPILAAMTPERARTATKLLAQWRNGVTDASGSGAQK